MALAEELVSRGAEVVVLGDVAVGWAAAELAARGLSVKPGFDTPADAVRAARDMALDVMVLDSYELDPACAGALRSSGVRVLAIVDDDPRGQDANIYLDQNLGAEDLDVYVAPGAVRLAGVRYALLRDSVRVLRPPAPPVARPADRPRVFCFFGGTDAFGAAPVVARLLVETARPFEATVVVGRTDTARALEALATGPGQSVVAVPPTDQVPRLIAGADLTVSASGTSTWELLCLGAAAALVWVADNQIIGFERVVSRGLAAGLGRLAVLQAGAAPEAVETLRAMLVDPEYRTQLSARAWAEVDGHGRARVADALC